jgi:hypothetical protein
MISYFGPFDSRFGRATFLGQDAVIVPIAPVKAPAPDPEPAGPQRPSDNGPLEPTLSIGGHPVPIVPLVVAGAITLGLIALVVATTSSTKRL